MHKFGVQFNFMKQMATSLSLAGILSIVFGILIIVYPALLNILVSVLLIIVGLGMLAMGARTNRYSKFEIKM